MIIIIILIIIIIIVNFIELIKIMHKTIYNNNSNIYVQSLKRKQNDVSRKRVKLTSAGDWKDLFKREQRYLQFVLSIIR